MDERVKELLREFPVVIPNPVAWAEMDAFRHVNNAVFFRYFENARIAYLTQIGLSDQRGDGIGPILHSTYARFRRPLRYPDVAWTGARVTEILPDRFTMEYRVVSEQDRVVVAEGGAVVVSYDYRRREKVDLPPAVRSSIDALSR